MILWGSCALWLGYPLQNGVWPDISKYDNDGILTGTFWEGDSLEFDGIDDFVNCGTHTSLDITGAITIEAWVKPNNLLTQQWVISRYTWTVGGFAVYVTTSGKLLFRTVQAGGMTESSSNDGIITTEWQHIVFTYSGILNDVKIYRNAVDETLVANMVDADSSPGDSLYVGKRVAGGFFNGVIASVRIYNTALTLEQIKESYQQGYRLV